MNTKEQIQAYLAERTNNLDFTHTNEFTTNAIAEMLHISRSIASQYLNELVDSGDVFKVKSRPVFFFDTKKLESKFCVSLKECDFVDMSDMFDYLHSNGQISNIFDKLIGYDGSLRRVVRQSCEIFDYPPYGLPFIIYGNEGTGKKELANLIYKHSLMSGGVIEKTTKVIYKEVGIDDDILEEKLHKYVSKCTEGSYVIILSHFERINEATENFLIRFFEEGKHTNIHFIFLSNRRPNEYLKSGLAKCIPLAVHLHNYDERPKEEREGIVMNLFRKEAEVLGVPLKVSSNVLRTLANSKYEDNIQGLSKTVKITCAQAVSGQSGNEIKIHTFDLPSYELEKIEITTEDVAYIDCNSYIFGKEIDAFIGFFDGVLNACQQTDLISVSQKFSEVFDSMGETLNVSPSKDDRSLHGTEIAMSNIINLTAQKHFINIPGYFNFFLARLAFIYKEYISRFRRWEDCHKAELNKAAERIKREYVSESMITDEINTLSVNNLEEEIPTIIRIIMDLMMARYNADLNKNKVYSVVICHGYSTATSIANAVNTLIGSYVFDSIDMPILTTVDEIKKTLQSKLERINTHADVAILVDMGSLEDVADESIVQNRNVAVINNVTTKMALSIGYKIKNGTPIDQLFENAEEDYRIEHTIIKGKVRDVILFTSASGFQTAQRMANLFRDSLPEDIPVDLQIVPFEKVSSGEIKDIQEGANILFITGTENPGIRNIPFIPLEGIITTANLDIVSEKLNGYLNEEALRQMIHNIRRNFTLINVVNYLTILNPKPLLDAITIAVDDLQRRIGFEFEGGNLIAVYIHVCVLVERLVTKTGVIKEDSATDEFVKNNSSFIKAVKESFKQIELHYNIEIPESEMKYLYSFTQGK